MGVGRRILFEIPYPIAIPIEIMFRPTVRQVPIGVKFETINHADLSVSQSTIVRRERFGNSVSSKVITIFPEEFDNIFSDDVPDKGVWPGGRWFPDRDGLYIKFAVDAVNKVIYAYRHVTGGYWIQRLNMGDIAQFEIQDYDDGEIVNETKRQITRGSVQMGMDPENTVREVAEILERESPINIYQEIHLDIRDKIDLGDYSLSVLLSFMLFERWTKSAFLTSVSAIKSEEKAHDLAFRDEQFKPLMHIIDLLDDHTNIDFKKYPQYEEWERNLYDVRNEVVHELYQPSFEEAGEAHEICISSIEWLQDELSPHIKGHQEDVEFSITRDFHELDPMNMYC